MHRLLPRSRVCLVVSSLSFCPMNRRMFRCESQFRNIISPPVSLHFTRASLERLILYSSRNALSLPFLAATTCTRCTHATVLLACESR